MPQTITKSVKSMLETARAEITEHSAADMMAKAKNPNVVMVDIRDPRELERDGRIRNWRDGLREVIRNSGATVVVVASENESDAYIAAGKDKGYGRANLVMTLQRSGTVFPSFFAQLFADMKRGVSMPVAWVKLAPQVPGHEHPDCPGTIFSCEAGQVAFK